MATLSAADLQKRHELEGAPDPFPTLKDEATSYAKPRRNGVAPTGSLDTESEQAFPSLAPSQSTAAAAAKSPAWGASAPRIAPVVPKANVVTNSFAVPVVDMSAPLITSGRDRENSRANTIGDAVKQTMAKYSKVKVEASSNQKARQTTFHLKSESVRELEKAKKALIALLSPQVSVVLDAPASTIAAIIGPKGATLKQIRDQTTVRVDIPKKEEHPQANGNGNAAAGHDDEDEEPTIPITISGPQPLVLEAQNMLNAIIATKTAKTTQRVRDIPEHILPFVIARRPEFIAEAGDGEINLSLNATAREISAQGDREAVSRVVEKIKATIEFLKSDLTSFSISLPKRQHRLLVGRASEEIMAKSKCSVSVPRPEDPNDQVLVWGNANDLSNGMAAIMTKANSAYIHEFPVPGPVTLSKQIITYMTKIGYPKTLAAAHPGISVYAPPTAVLNTAKSLNVDIVGDKPKVDAAVAELSTFVADLMGGTKDVEIDWLIHRVITGKYAKKIKHFHDAHNVRLFFPDESAEQSSVLLVYDPTTPSASRSVIEKEKHLTEVQNELLKLAHDAADVKSELIPVEAKWHSYVAGKDGTTLNAIIGEEKTLSIKIGTEAGGDSPDFILVRGASSDVDRAVDEIRQIVKNAETEQIDNSYSIEFEIPTVFVGRIVGSHGSAVNKLRDTLGVKVDFSDELEDKDQETGKKKKTTQTQKAKVKIVGRKENVEEAKKRILTQVERLADETSEVLKIPNQYHSSLIGQAGKYVIRLEEKYGVKITFPRENAENGEGKTREALKTDEVLIKGGKKGVAGAKSELLEALEFEKESNNVVKFTVPTKSVARILGRGGASINEIKDDTGAQIDVDRSSEDTNVTHITCRGTKKAIAAAKSAITAIADQVGQEVTVSLNIERRFHRTIIGAGGQGLRDLVSRCGGPTDPRQQASLIRFPHQSEPSDEVRLRGDAAIVKKLQADLQKIVEGLRDRVVLFVEVPNQYHRNLIGRNGQHLYDLQSRTGAQVQFPGSRSYNQIGEPENTADFKNADPQDLIKVSGTKEACEKAIKELTAHAEKQNGKAESALAAADRETVTDTVSVPLKYHHYITQQGNFFRKLRSVGVNVEQSVVPSQVAVPERPNTVTSDARIDADEEDGVDWVIIPNYQDAEEGDSVWTLKARNEASLAKAKDMIADAIQQAEESSFVGFLTLPDRSAFPRIVGSKGASVSRLRAETGAEITVSRENNTITIIGSKSSLEAAKEAIIRIASSRSRRGD